MNCNHCGAKMDEDGLSCPACGAEPETVKPEETVPEKAASADDEATVTSEGAEPEEAASTEAEPEGTASSEVEDAEAEPPETASSSEEGETTSDDLELSGGPEPSGDELPEEGAIAAPVRKKGLLPFILSLVVVAGLALGAYFAFFADGGPEEDKVLKSFDRFIVAMNNGDVDKMRACFVDGEIPEEEIPLFGPVEQFTEEIQSGAYGELDIDYTSAQTMVKGFVEAIDLKFTPLEENAVVLEEDGQFATLNLTQTFTMQGEDMEFSGYFFMKKIDGKWLITFST